MNLSRSFIDRPIFAGVISVLIFLSGLIAMFEFLIAEYREVSPPSIVVNARFPGANPTVIAETVATPLEEQINGVDAMLYLRNFATLNVKDQLARLPGVGQVRLSGSGDYAMRVWLNPDKVAERDTLTLSPALSALLLKDRAAKADWLTRAMDFAFGWFFRGFNRAFARSNDAYGKGVAVFVGRKGLMLTLYAGLLGLTYWGFHLVPPGFVPTQDKQYLISFAQ